MTYHLIIETKLFVTRAAEKSWTINIFSFFQHLPTKTKMKVTTPES